MAPCAGRPSVRSALLLLLLAAPVLAQAALRAQHSFRADGGAAPEPSPMASWEEVEAAARASAPRVLGAGRRHEKGAGPVESSSPAALKEAAGLHVQHAVHGEGGTARSWAAGSEETTSGVEVQILLNPTGRDVVGSRNLNHAVDDIRLQVAEGSRRGPRLKALLSTYGLDPLRMLPLPAVALGEQTPEKQTTQPPEERTVPVDTVEQDRQPLLEDPWPIIPSTAPPTEVAAEETSRASIRELLATSPAPPTEGPTRTPGLAGVMAIPEGAYAPKVARAAGVRIERGANGVERECSGGLCAEVFGDSGALLYPQ